MNQNFKQVDFEFRRRDLQEKYSYAVSRLGTCNPEKRNYWKNKLEEISYFQRQLLTKK